MAALAFLLFAVAVSVWVLMRPSSHGPADDAAGSAALPGKCTPG